MILGINITFKTDVSKEYAERVAEAIRMYHHIADVCLVESDISSDLAKIQEQQRITAKLIQFIGEIKKD